MSMPFKLARFAAVLEAAQLAQAGPYSNDCAVAVKPGKKYVRVDVGPSGKYMVDMDGNIFGIKGYGVIHRGHQYGTLDTLDSFDWGGYQATRKPATDGGN